jgi:sugar phosphate isomerase/epimerase
VKILEGANATSIGPAFCSHHWYANKASDELNDVLAYPIMKRLNYVVLTNGMFSDTGFRAVRFEEGQIDMAWLLANLYEFGYEGPISSQGWAIGGDPYVACKRFVDSIKALRNRFETQPELWPLH